MTQEILAAIVYSQYDAVEASERLGTIPFAEALLLNHKGMPSERSVIIYELANGREKQGKNAIHPHR